MGAELPNSDAHTMLFSRVTGQFRCPSLRMCGLPSTLVSFDTRLGSNTTELGYPLDVRFTPGSDRTADMAGGTVRAKIRPQAANSPRGHASGIPALIRLFRNRSLLSSEDELIAIILARR